MKALKIGILIFGTIVAFEATAGTTQSATHCLPKAEKRSLLAQIETSYGADFVSIGLGDLKNDSAKNDPVSYVDGGDIVVTTTLVNKFTNASGKTELASSVYTTKQAILFAATCKLGNVVFVGGE